MGLGCLSVGSAVSQERTPNQTPVPAEDLEKAVDDTRRDLDAAKQKETTLANDVAQLAKEREKLNSRLLETAALIQKSEGQMTAIEGRLSELELQEKLVRGSLSERHEDISELLAALQRMGRNPPPVMITKREDALEMVRSAMLLSKAFPGMRRKALELSSKLEDLVRVMTDIRAEGEKLAAETSRLKEMRTRLAGLMAVKKRSITERQAELVQVRQAAAEFSKSVDDLNDLIAKLDKTVSEKTALGDYEAEAASKKPPEPATAAEKETDIAALAPPVAKPGAPSVVELAPAAGTSLVPGSPGRIKPAIAFASAKGKLPLPAQGKRALSYGEKTQFGNTSKGVVIETRPNAQVTSPCDGWIVYAGEFRSYGQLLIINAGGGYHVLVAGLSQIDVQPGQFVLAAEPVGSMSDLPKTIAGTGDAGAPVLYIEFRKDGKPIDPDPWWVNGTKKVQG